MTIPATTLNDAREQIYSHFVANWSGYVLETIEAWGLTIPGVTGSDTIPYALGDETFDPSNSLWVRITVRHGITGQETLGTCGNRKFDRAGRVFIQGFMTPGGDEKTLDLAMEAARSLFEARTIGSAAIRFNAVAVTEQGVIEEGRWQAALAEAPFNYTTLK